MYSLLHDFVSRSRKIRYLQQDVIFNLKIDNFTQQCLQKIRMSTSVVVVVVVVAVAAATTSLWQ